VGPVHNRWNYERSPMARYGTRRLITLRAIARVTSSNQLRITEVTKIERELYNFVQIWDSSLGIDEDIDSQAARELCTCSQRVRDLDSKPRIDWYLNYVRTNRPDDDILSVLRAIEESVRTRVVYTGPTCVKIPRTESLT